MTEHSSEQGTVPEQETVPEQMTEHTEQGTVPAPEEQPPLSARQIIQAASETVDDLPGEKVFNRVNDLLLRVAEGEPPEALIEAQGILKEKRGLRHASDAKERGDLARALLAGLLA